MRDEGAARRAFRWRPWLRALHRDVGYLAVGLTVVYAASGLALDHVQSWDASFASWSRTEEIGPLPAGGDAAVTHAALARLGITVAPRDSYRAAPDDLEITFARRSLHVNPLTGHVVDDGQSPRFFLRVAGWLHENRGKPAWAHFADGYAVGLLFLALSGLFMIPGRKGIGGRGAVLLAIGAAVPLLYVAWSGGP